MAIVLRSNKSTALTFEELDGNFTDLNSRVSTIETTNVTAVNGQSGNITLVTDNINEGSTNLYYTNARFDTRLGTKTTDNLTEGTTNKYYSDSLVDTRLGTKSIDALSDVDTTTSAPSVSDVLTWDGTKFKPAAAPGASGGEANTGSNIGTGRNLFKQKVGINLEFNTLRSSDSIVSVVQNSGNDTVDISFLPTGDISANTQKIINVVNPASAQDAATKNYVDTALSGFSSSLTIGDGSTTDTVAVGTDTLAILGTANEIETAVTNNTVTIGLPNDLTLNGDITFTGANYNVLWDKSANSMKFADNSNAYFGTGDDLRIYHTGTHSFIKDGGTGNLRIQASDLVLETAAGVNYFKGYATGATEIYHNTVGNVGKKLETINTGIQTTGTININGAYTLPTADGTANQVLTTNGSGVVTFVTPTTATLSALSVTATATELNVLDGIPATLTTTEVGYLDGVTSAIQTQLNTLDTGKLALAGGTMAGGLAMGTNKITGMGDPTSAQDASTKAYVDAQVSGLSSILTIAADVGANDNVTVGTDNLTFTGGANIQSTVSNNTITLDLTGTVPNATDAVNADRINIQVNGDNATRYITFVDATSGDEDIYVDSNLTYNPSTNILTGGTFSGTATQAQYADLAEMYDSTVDKPGTVVVVGGEKEVRAYQPGDEYIAGVISTSPAFLMNKDAEGQPIALVGRVPVICTGPCTKGQPLLAIADGKVSMNGSGPVVGIALETKSESTDKLVEIMLKI